MKKQQQYCECKFGTFFLKRFAAGHFLCLFFLLLLPQIVSAELGLPALFCDHMVLQRDREIHVWGWGDPGKYIDINLAGVTTSTVCAPDGCWEAVLPALPASGPYKLTVCSDKQELVVQDILVGEVWLVSGQSNMEMILKDTDGVEEERAVANNLRIRHFKVPRKVSENPERDTGGQWIVCTPDKAMWFSAVAYYFSKELVADLDVPVGIINSSRGASQIIPWVPLADIEKNSVFTQDLQKWADAQLKYPVAKIAYEKRLIEWTQSDPACRGRKPYEPYGPGHYNTPAGLFNGMIAPLTRYDIRGVLWYQGEANANRADKYYQEFPVLINAWRVAFGQENLPFLFVQLPGYLPKNEKIPESWAQLRSAQAAALSLPFTAMAVTIDVGSKTNVHPKNKKSVGHRLALLAKTLIYGKEQTCCGPTFKSIGFSENQIIIHFMPGTAEGLKTANGQPPTGFLIAGSDGVFQEATAVISNDRIILINPLNDNVLQKKIRYAWENFPSVNLINSAGLPAVPFEASFAEPETP